MAAAYLAKQKWTQRSTHATILVQRNALLLESSTVRHDDNNIDCAAVTETPTLIAIVVDISFTIVNDNKTKCNFIHTFHSAA